MWCEPGSFGVKGVSPCTLCAVDKFSAVRGSTGCTPCPQGRISAEGATAIVECSCDTATIVPGPVAERFPDLRSHVADGILDQWATYGVQEWVHGIPNQDCDEVCGEKYLLCDSNLNDEVFFAMQSAEMQTIIPIVSDPPISCGEMTQSPGSANTPLSVLATCFFPGTSNDVSSCYSKNNVGSRLCACTNPVKPICPSLCTAGSYGLNGLGPCTPCPAGSTSITGASSLAQCKCDSGTYNLAPLVLLAELEGSFSSEILNLWKSHTVQEWVLGANGANCDDTCESKNMFCDGALDKSVIGALQESQMQALMPLISDNAKKCEGTLTLFDKPSAPSAHAVYDFCYRTSEEQSLIQFTCAATEAAHVRACPCSATPIDQCAVCPPNITVEGTPNTIPLGCPGGPTGNEPYVVPTVCTEGYFGIEGLSPCQPCAVNTYSSVEGASECTSCPTGRFSESVSKNILECLCDISLDPTCPDFCTPGTYGSMGIAPCFQCRAGTNSSEGSTNKEACICNSGTYPDVLSKAPFEQLVGHMPQATLDTWTSDGIHDWFLGIDNASCDDTCVANNMFCDADLPKTTFQGLQASDMLVFMPIISDGWRLCSVLNSLNDNTRSPSAQVAYDFCFFANSDVDLVQFQCGANEFGITRACPCSQTPRAACIICPTAEENGGVIPPGCEKATTSLAATPVPTAVAGEITATSGDSDNENVTTSLAATPVPTAVAESDVCGDGIVTGLEECDGGNVTNGDGCSSNCTLATGYACLSAVREDAATRGKMAEWVTNTSTGIKTLVVSSVDEFCTLDDICVQDANAWDPDYWWTTAYTGGNILRESLAPGGFYCKEFCADTFSPPKFYEFSDNCTPTGRDECSRGESTCDVNAYCKEPADQVGFECECDEKYFVYIYIYTRQNGRKMTFVSGGHGKAGSWRGQ